MVTTHKWIAIATVTLLHCSFVLSSWSSWTDYTQCSRSCGGGVKYRERLCVVDRLDRPVCKGKRRTYKLCNTKLCEGDPKDFRGEQCKKYNSKPLDGVLYQWRPYYGHGERCELLCFADGFPFFRKMADKVVDGTPCLQSDDRVCVDGNCMAVGCDLKIGSHKVFDVCGICGGDNSTCSGTGDINGIFTTKQLPPGYSTVVEIPAGAKDIYIRELAENKNSIVFWDSSGDNFAIDKDTRIMMPSVGLAGTQFDYKPEDKYNTHGRVQATGPTLRKVTVYAVNEGENNPGIRYSYISPGQKETYSQFGKEERQVTDSDDSKQKPVLKPGDIRISTSHQPSGRRQYGRTNVRVIDDRRRPTSVYDTKRFDLKTDNNNENKEQFVYQNAIQVLGGDNSITDNVYGKKENRTEETFLGSASETGSSDNYIANEIRYRVGKESREELESRGSRTSSRAYGDDRFMWSYGQWTDCSTKCGTGYQRRIVSCIDRERRESADQEYCNLELRPSNSRRCRNDDCQSDDSSSYVRWQVGEWGQCSRTCELGDQVQYVFCEAVFDNASTRQVDDERCLNQYQKKPQYRRSCNDGVACQQGHMWKFSKWSQCSVTCGPGFQQRSVTCRAKTDRRQLVTASVCNPGIKPVAMRRCDMGVCPPLRQRQRPARRRDCRNTYYGCCPDGMTPARGINQDGCYRGNIDQRLVRVGGRQILNCGKLSEQDREKTYILEWTKHGQASPVYKEYRWRWESYRTSAPEINPNFDSRVRIVGETSLEISQARETDSGLYTCTLLIPLSQSDSRKYSSQVFLDVRENIVITEDDSSGTNRVNPNTITLETCQQPPHQGTCRDFKVKWFYNSSSQVCERFWYGGCDGNANRFDVEDDCRRSCSQAAPTTYDDICKQPSVTGRCRAKHIRWYYNSNSKECQQFIYGGCGGNQNRFRTLADCARQCLSGTEALGDQQNTCRYARYGCCPDGVTSAQGNNDEGCPNACQATLYGCCDDDLTAAQGPNQEGCDEIEGSGEPCNQTAYGCCPDGVTAATGPGEEGCDIFIVDPPQPKPDTDTDITVGGDGKEVAVQCQLAKNTGPCKNYTVMWYYNTRENQCERFWYGGCDGNTNRFKSEKECASTCQNMVFREAQLPVCEQPKEMGPCRATIPRWFYNSRTRACEQFFYGGCQGNDNNFERQDECETRCGVVRESQAQLPVCEQPKEIGPCRANVPRWFYNSRARACEQFFYGGCQGNDNNFERQDECETRCGVVRERSLTAKEVCAQPQEAGPCRASIQKYYYNAETKRCEVFTYGGCGGNRNNFETEAECRQYCRAEVSRPTVTRERQPVCELTPDVGPCDRMQTKYFYNITTMKCEPFTYGGCLGNHNNFETEDKCLSYCGLRPGRGRTDDCQLSQEAGTCRGSIRRYYYDAQQGRCSPFSYGGCQGNRNNFADDRSCMTACQNVRIDRPVTRYPSRDKPGYCPLTDNRVVSTCTSDCRADYECNSNNKCCKNGCGGGVCASPLSDEPRRVADVCSLGLQTPCSRGESGPYWYYEKLTGQCREVPNRECNNNQNNFRSQTECEAYCSRERVCTPLTYESDIRCLAYMEHWTYNTDTRACEMFVYGGCGGSANNFQLKEDCDRKCLRQVVVPVTRAPVTRAPETSSPDVADVCSLGLQTPCSRGESGPYWYYEKLTGQCREVPNRECNNNQNNFRSQTECEAYCSRERVCTPLTYESDIRCLAYMEHWTYNTDTRACEMFVYGGCGGSANNFQLKEDCDRKCLRQVVVPVTRAPVTRAPETSSPGEVCAMAEDSGNCLAYIRNWRYDSLTGKCVQFTYGGCGGNANNFQSREECESFCTRRAVCQRNEDPEITCLAYMRRWRYEPSTGACENFVYGGCGGNANNFETVEACEAKCVGREREPERENNNNRVSSWREICNLQADVGPCKQYIKKWHYSSVSQSCEEFTYGGCLGNHNNFESQEQCMTYCDSSRWYNRPEPVATTAEPDIVIDQSSGEIPVVQPATGIDVCHLESSTGRCRAYIRSWYYDSLTGECRQFIYGGCDTNGNKFDTQEACEAQCSSRAVCMLPKSAGNCFAYITRYHFDYNAQECREFAYGGCDGNANNFESKEACGRRCDPFIRDRQPPAADQGEMTTQGLEETTVYVKQGSCPALRGRYRQGRCIEQCRSDRDCSGSKKCCVIACSRVCVEPEAREIRRPGVLKTGFCPARTDWQGILGACAPSCQEDSSCPGNQKCCHHGCGLKCVEPVSEEPYQMNAPERVIASGISSDTIYLTWYDPSLGRDQLIRDNRYYTIRYYSYGLGQYEYKNFTDLRGNLNGLRPDTEYEFNVRVNDPPYLSEWSDSARNRTASYVSVKPGQCPVINSDSFGICVEECQNDVDCSGLLKCCSNGCGQTCVSPQGYDACRLPKDPGSCSKWEVRWYFNTEIQRCDRFWYGGCNEGNANNFMDEIECQSKCTESQITPPRTPRPQTPRPYDCRRTSYGCCLDGYTPRLDEFGRNCAEYEDDRQTGDETVVPAIPGQSVTLTCRYGSNVTWYREGKLIESSSRRRVNSDGTIDVFSSTIEDDGMYACHVMGSNGQPTIYRYMLQVRVPIGVLPGPDKIIVKPNHQAFLHCEVYGNPKPSVSWHKGISNILSNGRYETFSNGTLLIRRATEQDMDSYTCTADNGVSTPVERTIKLELREMLVARIENDNGRVMEGGRIKLTCEGRGYPQPTITWEKMGRPLATVGNVYISSDGQQLTIRDVTTSDTGTYSCIVSNSEEKIETSTSVQVVPKVMPDDKCEDKTSLMKCRLIVTARLCGYTMYSKICCASCRRHFNGE